MSSEKQPANQPAQLPPARVETVSVARQTLLRWILANESRRRSLASADRFARQQDQNEPVRATH